MARKKSVPYPEAFRDALCDSTGPVHFIDPGITGTGYATWSNMFVDKPTRPVSSGCIGIANQSRPWTDRAAHITQILAEDVFDEYGSSLVVIEFPQLWSGSAKSQASAEKGSLMKLSYLIGMIGQVLAQDKINMLLVSPMEWKGQMSKDVVIRRTKRAFAGWSPRSHDADAVGMALSARGKL